MQYDYGDPRRGLSFEHTNLYDTLLHMGLDVAAFDYMELTARLGRPAMNRRLREVVAADKPDLLFVVLFTDQFDRGTFRSISDRGATVTFNWFCDDHWRFDSYSRHWAPEFHWVSTTDSQAVAKYAAIGCTNVVKTQWACNHYLYQPRQGEPCWDVSFIGQPHGTRAGVIAALGRAGIRVYCRGYGWPAGRVSQDEMIEVFSRSQINLNLSNASNPWWRLWRRRRDQIKGRNFEVPGCGGFLLTQPADDLEHYFEFDREIVCASTTDDLVDQIRYYLSHDAERAAVAASGLARTRRDHTYERRFTDIFRAIGMSER
jgi:spore maturation protein CgeB